ncbi:hypothetical protein [Sporisorium scitamineum]|uniref:Uncharacterized protein n=1 Tax=Sporisorium scitamineum TaxID=49012 RepID=A0A0F7S3U2_9BASI|nr:hypothetical protein [Sporisorium scitamineum]
MTASKLFAFALLAAFITLIGWLSKRPAMKPIWPSDTSETA